MTQWTDLFLVMPLPQDWLHGLLFIAFGAHLLFVLLMLGTAMLGLVFFLEAWINRDTALMRWDAHIGRSHLGLKSLAVVLGVAPLLIIQVRYSHAFFTVTSLFSYAWLAIIPLLILAFLLIDGLNHTLEVHPWTALACGILGVGALLTVPAVFTGALSLMERQELWPRFAAEKFPLPAGYAMNWLLRYLHVLGAAVAFGAVFHLFFSTKEHPERAPRLRKWFFGAILVQVVIGTALVFSANAGQDWTVLGAVTVGAAAAMLALWTLRPSERPLATNRPRSLLVLLPVILVSMLVARQVLQDRDLAPGHALAEEARRERSDRLAPYNKQALEAFTIKLATVYDNGATIYDGACQPCHGGMGTGNGPAAARLVIPAENIAAIRADRDYIYEILLHGTPGSAMPYFRFYDRDKLESLLDTLSQRYSMFAATPASAHPASAAARTVWTDTCSVCHGTDGGISEFGHTLLPAPPDLRVYSLTPAHALAVITNGYPGTAMQPFRALPEDVRQGLATISNGFRASAGPTK